MKRPGIGHGFLLVDKEQGWTSHDVVAKVRHLVGGKVGHAGTLDPMATGLLVLGLGRSTRLLRFVQGFEKEYQATALFGVATDSLDADGAILDRSPLPVDPAQLEAVGERFRGSILQIPPMVSARKVGGKRLYELARAGEVVEREARSVEIYSLVFTDLAPSDYPEVSFDVICSTGTYVRAIADDLARALGGRAHLTKLRRVRNGTLSVSDAVTVDRIETAVADGSIGSLVIDPATALSDIPGIEVEPSYIPGIRNGVAIPAAILLDGRDGVGEGLVRLLADGVLLGVYRIDGATAKPEVVTA
ncbi:MAG: tRNA pseudouridine(55) synthase TruB [Actinomycetota bacterium]|nr:tRNA pseudouridine(55) synthase TruB [Actinomycetota bacterium]